MKQHYIYKITDPVTEEYYIGSRTSKECSALEDDYMGSYKAWSPENETRLQKEVLCIFDTRKEANDYENYIIENCIKDKLNMNAHIPHVGFCNYGRTFTEEHINKIKEGNRGKFVSAETRRKMGKAHKGKTLSQETINKIKKSRKGYSHSTDTRKKISESNKGKTHTSATRQKLSKALSGRTFTDEWVNNLSEALEGRTLSEEHKKNISKARANIPPHPHKRKCMHIKSGKVYKTLTSAAEAHGVSRTTVVDHCKDKLKKKDFKYID